MRVLVAATVRIDHPAVNRQGAGGGDRGDRGRRVQKHRLLRDGEEAAVLGAPRRGLAEASVVRVLRHLVLAQVEVHGGVAGVGVVAARDFSTALFGRARAVALAEDGLQARLGFQDGKAAVAFVNYQ